MKLTGLFMLVSFVAISAGTYSQNARFSFEVENRTLHDLFLYIEQNSNLRFAYNKSDLDDARKVSCKFENESIEQILNKVLDTEKLSVSVKNEYVIITAKGGFEGKPYSTNINQPAKTVSGKVTDPSGSPLPGVTVAIKNTTQGTVSDANGNYSLTNVSGDAILVFSFVGMKTQEIFVTGKTGINVEMEEDAIGIEEVVAIGYGTQKKANITGAVSSVKVDKAFRNIPTTNLTSLLSGKMSGVNITSQTGVPGITSKLNIR
ncbi:MAG: carboxypeptidase-like regulatory domain-containing protein, partial [Mangrovibacterium sp.]|nr:carboxypeptidase-like regulatory domain-containing protein [Mangrovibacterium sp.]